MLETAKWQVAMERKHFSVGTIDGVVGSRNTRSLRQFQMSKGLPATGVFDADTCLALGEPRTPFVRYQVTAKDLAKVLPPPPSWKERAKAVYLGYSDEWEMLAEKFHTTPKFLKILNPEIQKISVGTFLGVPNIGPSGILTKAKRIEILLNEKTMLVYDATGRLQACFPCSIAASENKRPVGKFEVVNFAQNPNYTFNPAVMPESAKAEGIQSKLIIPPGPNNPVGLAWIGLSLKGYGIHGTPHPTEISRAGSHGCFRLANWNAELLIRMIETGTPVIIKP